MTDNTLIAPMEDGAGTQIALDLTESVFDHPQILVSGDDLWRRHAPNVGHDAEKAVFPGIGILHREALGRRAQKLLGREFCKRLTFFIFPALFLGGVIHFRAEFALEPVCEHAS